MTAALLALALLAGARAEDEGRQDVVLLAEDRPVFVRLRIVAGDGSLDAAWRESMRALRAGLDRDGDGKLAAAEADGTTLAALVRLHAGVAAPRIDLEAAARDGDVSADELAEALGPEMGPFRVIAERAAVGRTDALFDRLDRDQDGALTGPELGAIVGALRKLDRDDDEMIGADELEPYRDPATVAAAEGGERRARPMAEPPAVEAGSALRLARLLLRKYDKGRDGGPGRPDSRLSAEEFAIAPGEFAEADSNGDGALVLDELRRYLEGGPAEVALDVALAPEKDEGGSKIGVGREAAVQAVPHGDRDVEIGVGRVRMDVRLEDEHVAAEAARRAAMRRFSAADANKDGYLEEPEFGRADGPMAPLAGLFGAMDRDGDGKLTAEEMTGFLDRQREAARGRLVLRASDRGRALFGILDADHDRRLGAREMMRAGGLLASWDADGDGRVAAEEIPYHFRLTLSRGEWAGLPAADARSMPRPTAPGALAAAGPRWFRLMDRNRDGDISPREFLGGREQFAGLDRDGDGLIDAGEAEHSAAEDGDGHP